MDYYKDIIKITCMITWMLLPGFLNGAPSKPHSPTLDGGFWQLSPDLLEHFTDKQLATEVGYMKELGMDAIIIQYSAAPYWEKDQDDYVVYFENNTYPIHPAFQNRQVFDTIFKAADQHGVKVYLGGLLIQPPRWKNFNKKLELWTNTRSLQFRREAIDHFSQYKSFAGYYIPNEPNFETMLDHQIDPNRLKNATSYVSMYLRQFNRDMSIIKSIGLYLETFSNGTLGPVSETKLDEYWRPWISNLEHVDVWMVIDGVGTNLSNLKHTDMAQGWAKKICNEYEKIYWTDLENAHMGTNKEGKYVSSSFTISELEGSLNVAAKHADTIVTFDYIHYMSKQSHKPEARMLYTDYRQYLEAVASD